MDNKIVISLVSYLNTKPFLYGLEHSAISERLDLHLDCLLYTSPSPRDRTRSRMPSSA